MQLELSLPTVPGDPARARGLRRKRQLGPCPSPPATVLPTAPTLVEVLALLTRVRAVRVAVGELAATRLYDIRAFKTCAAELAYLHRLAAGGRHGGTVVTSMRQLVAGLAPLHPTWKLTGDAWEDRDCHQTSVRRRLSALAGAGLLAWSVRVDDNGEERATELRLLPVPELLADETAAALTRLALWEGRYDAALNTQSPLEIRDVKRAAAPLSASERQRRGCRRARRRGDARRRLQASQTNSAPPFGAPPTSEENNNNCAAPFSSNLLENSGACCPETRVTRPRTLGTPTDPAAPERPGQTASSRECRPKAPVGSPEWTEALLERVRARVAARQPILDVIAAQAEARATEVASWPVSRGWPAGRIAEAWAVWRVGPELVAEHSACIGGRLEPGDLDLLRRAAARYEHPRYAAARPEGYPRLALDALREIAEAAAARDARPRTLHYGIRVLHQLSRRMRAVAIARDVEHRDHQARRALSRRSTPAGNGAAGAPSWPAWVALDDRGRPIIRDLVGLQVIEPAPPNDSRDYLDVARDAYLLAGRWPPTPAHGALTMAMRNQGGVELEQHAKPGPYNYRRP